VTRVLAGVEGRRVANEERRLVRRGSVVLVPVAGHVQLHAVQIPVKGEVPALLLFVDEGIDGEAVKVFSYSSLPFSRFMKMKPGGKTFLFPLFFPCEAMQKVFAPTKRSLPSPPSEPAESTTDRMELFVSESVRRKKGRGKKRHHVARGRRRTTTNASTFRGRKSPFSETLPEPLISFCACAKTSTWSFAGKSCLSLSGGKTRGFGRFRPCKERRQISRAKASNKAASATLSLRLKFSGV